MKLLASTTKREGMIAVEKKKKNWELQYMWHAVTNVAVAKNTHTHKKGDGCSAGGFVEGGPERGVIYGQAGWARPGSLSDEGKLFFID